MPRISAIKPQRSKKRVNIYLDGKFGFGLDLENYVKFGLKVGRELGESEIARIVKEAEFQKILNKLLKFATLRPRSKKEIMDWFKKRKVHESIRESLLDRLKHLELIDDEKFAEWWVEQRMSFNPRGKRLLENELFSKGIEKEIIKDVLSNIDIDEVKIATELLEKKGYRWKNLEEKRAKEKMTSFLGRKGFSWEIIKSVINSFFN